MIYQNVETNNLEFLGSGMTSHVFKYDSNTVVKDFIGDGDYEKEIKMFEQLNRAGISFVPKLKGHTKDLRQIFVEYVKGTPIHFYMQENGFKEDLVYKIINKVLEVRKLNILANDLHGDNIIVNSKGDIIFIDIDLFFNVREADKRLAPLEFFYDLWELNIFGEDSDIDEIKERYEEHFEKISIYFVK